MIQFTGTINSNNGVVSYNNAEVNLYIASPNKFADTIVVAQIGKTETNNENTSFTTIAELYTYYYSVAIGTDFDTLQNLTLTSLQNDFPGVTFELI